MVAGVIVAGGGVKDNGTVPFFPYHGQYGLHAANGGGSVKVIRPEAAADPTRHTAEGGVIGGKLTQEAIGRLRHAGHAAAQPLEVGIMPAVRQGGGGNSLLNDAAAINAGEIIEEGYPAGGEPGGNGGAQAKDGLSPQGAVIPGQLAAQGIGGGIAGVAQPKEYPQRNNGGNEDYYANRDEKDFHLSSSCAIITRVGSDRAACVVVFYLH